MKPVIFFVFLILLNSIAFADELDRLLRDRIKFHNLRPIQQLPPNPNEALVELGKLLFSEKNMSGNRRMSCITCHNPNSSTTDGHPMSQTENGLGILTRNSPSLFNVGLPSRHNMFWDGRVSYDPIKKVFTTPEPALNGEFPERSDITNVMSSALASQSLFPLVNSIEMKGVEGENEIANAKTDLEAWDKIIDRLKENNYTPLFLKAYPELTEDKINIGHVGEALAAFERENFQAHDSPFQRYLKGDNRAMSVNQKRGFAVFLGRGRCINCHTSGELGKGDLFASVATPQWGAAPFSLDKGQGDILKDPKRNFFFKVPSLVNIKLTGPYMHNGAFETLRKVIDHYDHISETLNKFKISSERQQKIPVKVVVSNHPLVLDDIWLSSQSGLIPELKNKLRLIEREKRLLETFLREALTDPRWDKK